MTPRGGKPLPVGGSPCTPVRAAATTGGRRSSSTPSYHARPRTPAGDSPYMRAKHAQLVEKDPNKAVSLFWAAINSGDRVDSALKDMALVMKQVDRAEEAIEAIKSFRSRCPSEDEESLDNILLDLYKKCDRIEDQIELLNYKLKLIDEGLAFGGRSTRPARAQGKKFHITLVEEKSRLLGNLAWAYMQCGRYKEAEHVYREALEIEPDFNKQCNLAICLMKTGRLSEARVLLQGVRESLTSCNTESFIRSFERASGMLMALDSQWSPNGKKDDNKMEGQTILPSANDKHLIFAASATISAKNCKNSDVGNIDNSFLPNESASLISYQNWKREFLSKRVTSPIPCSVGSSNYFTPPETRKQVDGHGSYNRRWNPYQEALHSSISSSENKRHGSRGPWTDPRSSVDRNRNSGTCIKNWAVGCQKRTEQNTKEYRASDKNRTLPEISIQSQAKASRRLNFERWNKEHSQISYNVPASGIRILKPLTEDSLIINGERWIRACQMDKLVAKSDADTQMPRPMIQSCAANENVLLKTPDRQRGCSLDASVNSNLNNRLRTLVKGSKRCDNEAISSNISASVNECMTPAHDSSTLISSRRPLEEHVIEKFGVETPTDSLEGTPMELTVNRSKMDMFREKVAFRSWKSIQYLNSGSIAASNAEQSQPRGDSLLSKNRRQTWAGMVKEEEREAIEKSTDDAKIIPTVGRFKESSEEHFSTPSVLKSWRTWADMVEEEEHEVDWNPHNGIASINTAGSFRDSPEEDHIQTQPVPKGGKRRTWADMVEEAEHLVNENLDSVSVPIDQASVLKSSVPNTGWDDSEAFQDENVDLNIMQSTPQRHRVSHKLINDIGSKLEMVDLQEGLKSGGKANKTSACRSLPFGQQEKLAHM